MAKRKQRPYQRKGERHPYLVRGTFYHHLRLGIRITFERAYSLPDDMKYVVVCNGTVIGYSFGETAIEAERIFDAIEARHSQESATDTAASSYADHTAAQQLDWENSKSQRRGC